MTSDSRLNVVERILKEVRSDCYSFPGEERLFALPHSDDRRYGEEKWYLINDEGDYIVIERRNVNPATYVLEADGSVEDQDEFAVDLLLNELEAAFELYKQSSSYPHKTP